MNGPRQIRHRLCGIRNVGFEVVGPRAIGRAQLRGCAQAQCTAALQVKLLRECSAPGLAAARPGGQRLPAIHAGLECGDRRQFKRRCIVFQVVIEKWPQQKLAKVFGGVAAKANLPDRTAVEPFLMVKPGADHQVYIRSIRLPRLERLVERDVAVDILLVPETVDQHDGHGDALFGENFIERLVSPEFIVRRMVHHLGRRTPLVRARGVAPCHPQSPR